MPATPASNRWPDDSPPERGWWKASDGQWYPPSSAPGYWGPGYSAPGGPAPSGGYGFNPYGPPPGQQQWGVPAWSQPQSNGNGFSIAGIVLGAVALLFVPPLFGILGIVFAGIGLNKKERLAKVALIVSIVGLVLGMVLGVIVMTTLSH